MRPAHNVTRDLYSCMSSVLANAVSFLKWLRGDQTPPRSFLVRRRCNAKSLLQAGRQIMVPQHCRHWGKQPALASSLTDALTQSFTPILGFQGFAVRDLPIAQKQT